MRHVLTMAVGVGAAVRILYYAVELEPSDILLLTTDGLHGVVPEADIKRILQDEEIVTRSPLRATHGGGA